MNVIDKSRANAFGKFTLNSMMKNSPTINLKNQNTNRDINMLNNYQRRAIPTIYSNNNPSDDNIAIYRTRSNNSLMNVEENGSMELFTKIRNGNQSKIRTLNEDLLPNYGAKYETGNQMDIATKTNNKSTFYPFLPNSPTNQFPKNEKPTLMDPRIFEHTTERDYKYEKDQVADMINMIHSPSFYDKLNRQMEAERVLQGAPEPKDWVEPKVGYFNRPYIYDDVLEVELKKRIEDQQKYNSLDNEKIINQIEKIGMSKINYDMDNLNPNVKNIFIDRNHENPNFSYVDPYQQIEEEKPIKKSGIISTLTNLFTSLFKNQNKNSNNERQIKESFENEEIYNDFNINNPYQINREKSTTYVIKNDGILKTSQIEQDTPYAYASMFVSPYSKMMAMENNGNLILIQKFKDDAIFGNDLRPYNDDLIITVLPNTFTSKIRDRIQNSEGRKFKELNSSDYYELYDYILKNPSVQHRVKPADIRSILKDSEIDLNMFDNFSGKKILIDNEVLNNYFQATNLSRFNKQSNKNKNYQDINDREFEDEYIDFNESVKPTIRQEVKVLNERSNQPIDTKNLDIYEYISPQFNSLNHSITNQLINAPKSHTFSNFNIN